MWLFCSSWQLFFLPSSSAANTSALLLSHLVYPVCRRCLPSRRQRQRHPSTGLIESSTMARKCENIQEFLEKYMPTDLTADPIPLKVYKGSINESELFGQSMQWAMEYMNMRDCPPKLLETVLKGVRTELDPADEAAAANNNGSSLLLEKLDFKLNENPNEPLKLMQAVIKITDSVLMKLKDTTEPSSLISEMNGLALSDQEAQNSTVIHGLSYFTMKNSRRTNEDRLVVYPSLNAVFGIKEPGSYFGVFDGHNGAEAAVYGAAQLHQAIIQNMKKIASPKEAIVESFLSVDKMFCEKAKNEQLKSGSTVVTAVITGKTLLISWLGDSQAVLYHDNKINDLVNPHKPEREDERLRIEAEGGEVLVVNNVGRVNGNLAISRSLGDTDYKNYVSGLPDVIEIDLNALQSEYLVLASDGLWDVCSGEDVQNFVDKMIVNNDIQDCARQLAYEAKRKSSGDNVSIIVVCLQSMDGLKSVAQARIDSIPGLVHSEENCPTPLIDLLDKSLEEQVKDPENCPTPLIDLLDKSLEEQAKDPENFHPVQSAPEIFPVAKVAEHVETNDHSHVRLVPAKASTSAPNAISAAARAAIGAKKACITTSRQPVQPVKLGPAACKSPATTKVLTVKSPIVPKPSGTSRSVPGTSSGASSSTAKATNARSPHGRHASATTATALKRPQPAMAKRVDPASPTKPKPTGAVLGNSIGSTLASDTKSSTGTGASNSKLPSGVTKAPLANGSARPMARKDPSSNANPLPRKPTVVPSAPRPEVKQTKPTLTRPAVPATVKASGTKSQTAIPGNRVGATSSLASRAAKEKYLVPTVSSVNRGGPVLKAKASSTTLSATSSTSKSATAAGKPKTTTLPLATKMTSRTAVVARDKNANAPAAKSKSPNVIASAKSKTNTSLTKKTDDIKVKEKTVVETKIKANEKMSLGESDVKVKDAQFPGESDVKVKDEQLPGESEAMVKDEQLPGESNVMVTDEQLPGENDVTVKDEQLLGEIDVMVKDEQLPRESDVMVKDEQLPGESDVMVKDEQLPGESDVMVKDEQLPGESDVMVKDEQLPGESNVKVKDEQFQGESDVKVKDEQIQGESDVKVKDEQFPGESDVKGNEEGSLVGTDINVNEEGSLVGTDINVNEEGSLGEIKINDNEEASLEGADIKDNGERCVAAPDVKEDNKATTVSGNLMDF